MHKVHLFDPLAIVGKITPSVYPSAFASSGLAGNGLSDDIVFASVEEPG